jgi:hypothetical protein
MPARKKPRKRQESWRGRTLSERVKLLEQENNALNRMVLELSARITKIESDRCQS